MSLRAARKIAGLAERLNRSIARFFFDSRGNS